MTDQGLSCIDNINNILYYIYQQTNQSIGLYGYNLQDTTKTVDPIPLPVALGNPDIGDNEACLNDPNTGDMYVNLNI